MKDGKRARLIALRIIVAGLIVLWASFIFGFSGQTGGESGGLSAKVADALVSAADFFTGATTVGSARASAIEALQFPIRKAAHMSEYAVLALLVLAQLRLWPAFGGTGKQSAAPMADMTGDGDDVRFLEDGPTRQACARRSARGELTCPPGEWISPLLRLAGPRSDQPDRPSHDVIPGAPTAAFATPAAAYLRTLRRAALVAWGAATLYAATDEFHQLFVPGRAGLPTDVLIDATGAALGLFVACSLMAAFYLRRAS
ncbi:VanZ family protein [Parvibacter caecicola]|uniref:VanZ family protein n=1 Tax=Parvibacter caecicola TaxID=747645 RepID=UPI00249BB424|nr:VanZ family protein [Parvibacter caecicola]